MAYSTDEQALYDHLRATLPRFLFQTPTASEEIWGGFVKIFDAIRAQIVEWRNYAEILQATGIWLDQHARDRGAFRQEDETDEALRERLSMIEDMVTTPALTSMVDAILAADGVVGSCAMVELRRDRAHFGDYTATGKNRAYLSRGYRMSVASPSGFIVILPFGTGDATRAAVAEALRAKKAGGFNHYVEVRGVP